MFAGDIFCGRHFYIGLPVWTVYKKDMLIG